jgi:hypothetical protein
MSLIRALRYVMSMSGDQVGSTARTYLSQNAGLGQAMVSKVALISNDIRNVYKDTHPGLWMFLHYLGQN